MCTFSTCLQNLYKFKSCKDELCKFVEIIEKVHPRGVLLPNFLVFPEIMFERIESFPGNFSANLRSVQCLFELQADKFDQKMFKSISIILFVVIFGSRAFGAEVDYSDFDDE